METADLLCVIYVTGIKNNELREKLLEISCPTIEKFDRVVVDSFDQAKKQLDKMRSPATMAATQQSRGRQQQRNQRQNNNRRQEGRPEALDKERSDKIICFRCGKKDHTVADCPRPAHHRCSKCGKQGHIRPACRQAIANNADSQEEDLAKQLASLTVSNPVSYTHLTLPTIYSV